MITHLESDILEYGGKWALQSITMKKVNGNDGIPAELFHMLKDDSVKVVHSYAGGFGKLSSDHRTGKGQFSFQYQRKALQKNVQIIAQLHSSHMPAK